MDYSLFMLLWRHLENLKLRAYLELCNLFTVVTDNLGRTHGLKIELGNDVAPCQSSQLNRFRSSHTLGPHET